MRAPLYAGVELGGSKCVCLLATGPDDVRERIEIPTEFPQVTLPAIAAVLARWRDGEGAAGLGVATFGPVELDEASPRYGRVLSTPKPGWTLANLTGLAEAAGAPMALDTDVNGAALAEGLWGAAQGLRSWTYITVGTGVGVGGIVDGQPVRGLGHSEAGHLRVPRRDPRAWPGACPFHGDCVEGLASGAAVAARTGRSAKSLPADDPAWNEVVETLAGLLHNLVLTTTPQRILLGGGVPSGHPHLLPRLRRALADSLGGYAHGVTVAQDVDDYLVPPGLGPMAGPLGAIALARRGAG